MSHRGQRCLPSLECKQVNRVTTVLARYFSELSDTTFSASRQGRGHIGAVVGICAGSTVVDFSVVQKKLILINCASSTNEKQKCQFNLKQYHDTTKRQTSVRPNTALCHGVWPSPVAQRRTHCSGAGAGEQSTHASDTVVRYGVSKSAPAMRIWHHYVNTLQYHILCVKSSMSTIDATSANDAADHRKETETKEFKTQLLT